MGKRKHQRNRRSLPPDTLCPICHSPETALVDNETGMWGCISCSHSFQVVDSNACVACGGSGISSKQGICVPCDGWGYRDLANAVRQIGGQPRPVSGPRTPLPPRSPVPILGTIVLEEDEEEHDDA